LNRRRPTSGVTASELLGLTDMDVDAGDTSIAGLIRGLASDIRALIHEELALARMEVRDQAGRARTAAVAFGIAGVALALGGAFMLVAAATGIAHLLNWPVWSGFFAVAVALGVVGLLALATGRRKLRDLQALPEQTVTTLKENSEWIAKRLSSAPR
jgi:MFS family permease